MFVPDWLYMNTIIPLYFQIKQTIKGWIINKEFTAGEKIPSENELIEIFGVSRLTIRQALSHLVQEGFLISKRGEGTFVTNKSDIANKYNVEFTGVMDDLFFQQLSRRIVKRASISAIKPSRYILDKLELDPNEKEIIQLKRVCYETNEPFTFIINYLPRELGSRITEEALYQKPLFKILEEEFGIYYAESVQTIEASFANSEVAESLMIPNGSPILYVERVMYDQTGRPVQFFQLSYRADMYRIIVRARNVNIKNRPNKPGSGTGHRKKGQSGDQ
jgi:GntR family transcriptional regulator